MAVERVCCEPVSGRTIPANREICGEFLAFRVLSPPESCSIRQVSDGLRRQWDNRHLDEAGNLNRRKFPVRPFFKERGREMAPGFQGRKGLLTIRIWSQSSECPGNAQQLATGVLRWDQYRHHRNSCRQSRI